MTTEVHALSASDIYLFSDHLEDPYPELRTEEEAQWRAIQQSPVGQ